MANQPSFLSPISPFLTSPKFITKKLSDHSETFVSSPVSVLETKNSPNPFAFNYRNPSRSSSSSPGTKQATQAIGLALIYSIIEEENLNNDGNFLKPFNRFSLLRSRLKIQFSEIYPTSPPSEFGTKTKSCKLSSPLSRSRDLVSQLSLKEMELYEDYTCVITHGPNPKTTHIFDECIVQSNDDHTQEDEKMMRKNAESSSANFCDYCKEILKLDKDIFTSNSGEDAFCSEECRFQEMIHSEELKIEEPSFMKNK